MFYFWLLCLNDGFDEPIVNDAYYIFFRMVEDDVSLPHKNNFIIYVALCWLDSIDVQSIPAHIKFVENYRPQPKNRSLLNAIC